MTSSDLNTGARRFTPIIALLCLAAGGPLRATVVPRVGFEELNARSERIVHARCVATDAFLEAESGTIWTRNYFEILDTLKGEAAARIVVMEPGGVIGNQGQWVAGAPRFSPGDESVLFLSQTVTGKWRVFGWGQGNYRVLRDAANGEARVKPDLAGAEVAVPAGAGAESAAASPSDPAARATLDGLKIRIRKQMLGQGAR
jgi:hypothetical protein